LSGNIGFDQQTKSKFKSNSNVPSVEDILPNNLQPSSSNESFGDHFFVTGFFDLHGFRDDSSAYVDSVIKLIQKLPNLFLFCEPSFCETIRRKINLAKISKNIEIFLSETQSYYFSQRRTKERISQSLKNMMQEHTIKRRHDRRSSDILRFDLVQMTSYISLNHLKFELLDRASEIFPWSLAQYFTWIDAGIFRHLHFVDGANFSSIAGDKCYLTKTARFATQSPRSEWPPTYNTIYLFQGRREVAAPVMTFNKQYFKSKFFAKYLALFRDLLNENVTTSEQGLLSLLIQGSPEIDHIPTGYTQQLKNMFDCKIKSHQEAKRI
jgi:hypothetical protein